MPSSVRHRFLIVAVPAFRRIIFLFMWVVRSTTSVCSIARATQIKDLLAAVAPFGATVIYTDFIRKTGMYYTMRLVCRKCGLECDATTFEEVEQYQRMTCGAGGTHRLVGIT